MNENMIWYGTEASAKAYMESVQAMGEAQPSEVMAYNEQDFDEERFGEYGQFIMTQGNTAVISVTGSLGHKESWWSMAMGDMTYETLANCLAEVVSDGGFEHVLLDIDSPGGIAKGLDVATDAMAATKEAGISVDTHTSGWMMSAAYWIGSAGDNVGASKTAEVGSVGVILVHQEYTKMLDNIGIKATVFRKGDEKALGSPYEKLDAAATEAINRRIDRAHGTFVEAVSQHRGLSYEFVENNIASGREYSSAEAKDLQLIDEVVPYNDAVTRLMSSTSQDSTGASFMSKQVIQAQKPEGLGETPEDKAAAVAAGIDPATLEGKPSVKEEEAGEKVTEPGANAGNEGTDEGDEGKEGEGETTAETTTFSTLLADLNTQLIESKIEAKEATANASSLKASNAGLRGIVVEQTERMRVAVGIPVGADLKGMADDALVESHQQVRGMFMERFASGPVSQVPEKDTKVPEAVITRFDQAARRATSFK